MTKRLEAGRVFVLCAMCCILLESLWAGELFPGGTSIALDFPGGAVLTDDLDRDGLPDIVVAHESHGRISVLFNQSSGRFSSPSVVDVGLAPVSLTSGDLDDDGLPDLLVVNSGSSTVSVLLHRGGRVFESSAAIQLSGLQPRVAQLADFDGDGHFDLAVSNLSTFDVDVLFGNGRGGFPKRRVLAVGEKPHSIAVGDFDDDGFNDLAVPLFEDITGRGQVYWFPGRADGTFGPRISTPVGVLHALRFSASGDFDSDGSLDLSVIDLGGAVFSFRNQGSWDFAVERITCCDDNRDSDIDPDSPFSFFFSVDIEADGDLDLITRVERYGEGGFRVHENDGRGGFRALKDVIVDGSMASLVFADFDGDGINDALATWVRSPQVVLFRGDTPGRLAVRDSVPLPTPPRGLSIVEAAEGKLPSLVAFGSSSVHFVGKAPGGAFALSRSVEFPGRSFQDMAAADFDGIPGPELAFTDLVEGEVLVLSGDGRGAVLKTLEHAVGDFPTQLEAGDFDGDGIADLAVAHRFSPLVTVLLRPGREGTPAAAELRYDLPVGSGQTALAVADVNADGEADLVVATEAGVKGFLGDGKGRFPSECLLDFNSDVIDLRVCDLDVDGSADLLIAGERRVAIVYSVAQARNPTVRQIDLGFSTRSLEVGDVSGDKQPDIVLAAESKNAVAVIRCVENRAFAPTEFYGVGISPRGIVLGDLDRDGKLDAATADLSSRSISILRGLRGRDLSFRRGDVDVDERADITDAIVLLRALFLGGGPLICPDGADTNDDGALDLTDAVYLLLHLFRGGAPPPDPGPKKCGVDPTEDELGDCTGGCE